MKNRTWAVTLAGLLLIGSIQAASADQLYVRNRIFKGPVKKSDGRIWVDLKTFAQAMGANLVELPEGGTVVTMGDAPSEQTAAAGKVVIAGEETETQPGPDGLMVPLDVASKLMGARVIPNKAIGTIDVSLGVASSSPKGQVSSTKGATSAAVTGPIHKNINRAGSAVDVTDHLVPGRINIVDFYADWCPPCRALAPKLDAMSQNTKYAILKVDIANWKSPVAQKYNLHSIPHLKVYDASGRLIAEGDAAYKYIK
jgi:thiol-disulfide isomerase/thioredoxin